MGNITQIADDAQQDIFFNGQVVSPSQTFEYDALYRLIEAAGREHASMNADAEPEIEGYNPAQASPEDGMAMRNYMRRWEYDEVGNILRLIHQANSNSWTRDYAYAAGSNRLNSTTVGQTAVNYTYNAHGSMVAMPHLQEMEWDFAERLFHITRGTTEAYYNYDSSGERVRKVVEKGNIIEERIYLGGFEIFRKRVNGNLELERETLHIMDDARRIAVVETLTVDNGTAVPNPEPVQRYQLGNHLESAALELDENANIISYEEYYPYGDTSYRAGRSVAETGLKRYRYCGKEKDEESGLYYHGARYYACWLGRWTAADPMGMVDGVNLYVYCRGNPVGLMDKDGMGSNSASSEYSKYTVTDNGNGTQTVHVLRGGATGSISENHSPTDDSGISAIVASGIADNNEYRVLSKEERDSSIMEIINIMEKHGLDATWVKDIQKILKTEDKDDNFLEIALDRRSNKDAAAAFIKEKPDNSKSIICFNLNFIADKNPSNEKLQAYFIHELRHFWQHKNNSEWEEKLTMEFREKTYKNILIEVDAHDIQFEFERKLKIEADANKADLSMRYFFEMYEKEHFNDSSREEEEKKKAHYLWSSGYQKDKGYINPFDPSR